MTSAKLCQFLREEQNESPSTATEEECKELIKIYEKSPDHKNKGEMTSSGFLKMLYSPRFDLFNSKHKVIYQDMSQPLSDYWIASSHNT